MKGIEMIRAYEDFLKQKGRVITGSFPRENLVRWVIRNAGITVRAIENGPWCESGPVDPEELAVATGTCAASAPCRAKLRDG